MENLVRMNPYWQLELDRAVLYPYYRSDRMKIFSSVSLDHFGQIGGNAPVQTKIKQWMSHECLYRAT